MIYAGFRFPLSHSRTTSMPHIFVMRQSVLPPLLCIPTGLQGQGEIRAAEIYYI